VTADPDDAVAEAARAMRRAGIDLVLVFAGARAAGQPPVAGVPTLRAPDRAALAAALAPPARRAVGGRA